MSSLEKYGPFALVTGASSGLGQEYARQLAASGLNLVLLARRNDVLEDLATKLTTKHNVVVQVLAADLTEPGGLHAVRNLNQDVGLLVHAAGLEVNGAFIKSDADAQRRMLQLNVTSTFDLVHHFLPKMVDRGCGGVVLFSSLSGHMPNPYFANYAGSKAYVLNFGASLRAELAGSGVDMHVVSPGPTDTPMAEGTGVDWSKVPSQVMTPEVVVRESIANLGGKFLTAPGYGNKMAVWMAKHMPSEWIGRMNARVMQKALPRDKL